MNIDEYTKQAQEKADEARRQAAEFDDKARAKFGKGFYFVAGFALLVVAGMLIKCAG